MQRGQLVTGLTALALVGVALSGLSFKGRLRRVWSFPAYLLATGVADLLVLAAPHVFGVWSVWATRELVLRGLSLAIAIEVALRVFASLPRAALRARIALVGVLALTALALVLIPWHGAHLVSVSWIYVVVTEALPRLAYGACWLCVAVILVMNVHGVPPDPLHRSVLAGLAAYLVVYSVGLGMQRGPRNGVMVYVVTPLAYNALLAYWTWAAWRNEPPPRGASSAAVEKLHPWK